MSPYLILAALQTVTVAPPAAAPAEPTRDIVVTGQRLDATGNALAQCLARHCQPEEDIKATLAHAENQFVAGGYEDARQTLQASINRNKRYAKTLPVPVSDLLRANSRVDLHLGEASLYRLGTIDSLVALKAGLPAGDPRVLAQRVEVADADARLGRAAFALDEYRAIADDAHGGSPTVEGYARLRRVVLLTAMTEVDGGYASSLRDAVKWFADRPDLAPFRAAAELIAAQYAMKKGDPAAVDALIARYAKATTRPQLLYAPVSVQQDTGRASASGSVTGHLATGNFDDQWVDISFWVKPDGKVDEVETLRESKHLDPAWVKPIAAGIAQRRYAPLTMDPGSPGLLRVERYTLTAHWGYSTESRIRQREAVPRIEMVDLTADPAAPPPAPKG